MDPGRLVTDAERKWLTDRVLAVISVLACDRAGGRSASSSLFSSSSPSASARLAAGGELRVRLVTDAEMSAAHQRHLADASTTDVLTFDMSDPDSRAGPADGTEPEPAGAVAGLDADLLACVDVARRRAAEAGHDAPRELLLYAVHGLLHCLGYDDHDDASAALMHAEEDRLLSAVGVGPTYASGAGR